MKLSSVNILPVAGLLGVVVLLVDCQVAKAPPSEGVELFNGKDFTGWTFFVRSNSAPEETWIVTNGLIHCAGRPSGY